MEDAKSTTVEHNGITPDTTSKHIGYIQFNFQSKWITQFSPQQRFIKPLRMPAEAENTNETPQASHNLSYKA